ncbi:MAG: hypothetical protein MK028_04520 [Dehalococcoidia bacterium]|nr:hypothetical protein [Chloroflexota bacterium]MCH2525578.1 hypothetical protein [Dehalococcoidia bacterium]MQF99858.1 hypothetical protein [SAR202 cluster bacterium]
MSRENQSIRRSRSREMFRSLSGFVLLLLMVVITAVSCSFAESFLPEMEPAYEVWSIDQSGTESDGTGGLLYIWDGKDIFLNGAKSADPEIIDLAKAAKDANCEAAKKPHMILSNHTTPKSSHAILANVGSGDTFFINIASRSVVGCVNTIGGFNGAGGTGNTHASVGSPDNSMTIVANIGAKGESGFLHKIQTNYTSDNYKLVETLSLDQFSSDLGTSVARPICHEFTADSKFAYVTLAGGGILVIDVGAADGSTAMNVVKVYDAATVPGIGCGVTRLPFNKIMTNGESGAKGGDDFLYTFDASKAAEGIFPNPVQIELPGEDTHGAVTCIDQRGGIFAITSMRVSNDVNFVDLQTNKVVATQSMAASFSPDPKPDVAHIVGNKMFIALRGATPLSAIGSLPNVDRTPGVAVLTISDDCKSFSWDEEDLASMEDLDRMVTLEDGSEASASDPHGLEIILK